MFSTVDAQSGYIDGDNQVILDCNIPIGIGRLLAAWLVAVRESAS